MNNRIGIIYWILIVGLIIRLFLSTFPAFESDQQAFRFWSDRLATLGLANFYSSEVFTNNPLGILYFFWLIGVLKNTILSNFISASNIDIFLKLAANLSDLATGFLIYKIIRGKMNERLGNIATVLYIFNPVLIFNSAIWGQYDSVAILFLVLSIYYCIIKRSPVICSFFFTLACITKPQSIELAPFLFIFFLKYFKPIQLIYSFLASIIISIIVFFPFFPNNPIYGIYYVNIGSANLFSCTTCNAFNFWGVIGNWQNDMNLFLGLSMLNWGLLLFSAFLIIIFSLNKLKEKSLFLTITISMLAFFMLLTRMHERYITYFFPFLLLSAFFLRSKIILSFYISFALIFLLNLYIPYAYYNNLVKITNLPTDALFSNFNNFSLISFLGFILLFIYYIKNARHN